MRTGPQALVTSSAPARPSLRPGWSALHPSRPSSPWLSPARPAVPPSRRAWPRFRVATLVVAGLICAACAAATTGAGSGPDGTPSPLGSLRQDEITLTLRTGAVEVKFTPLDPAVLELTAPDTRERLSTLAPTAAAPDAFLVSVFTQEPGGADFEPGSVFVENRGRRLAPTAIRPVSPGWGGRLTQQRVEQAVYVFSGGLDLELPLVVEAAGVRNGAWVEIRARLDAERARARARRDPGRSP